MNFHFAIPVTNVAESEYFYGLLGFQKTNEWFRPEQELEAVIMQNNGCTIELVCHPSNRSLTQSQVIEVRHLGLEVSDLAEMLLRLKENKVDILKPQTSGITVKYYAFIKDPDGFPIELFEVNKN